MTSESARSPATCTSYLRHKNRQSDFLAAHRQTRRSCVLDWTRRSPGLSLPEIAAFQATRARLYVNRNLSRTAALQRVDNQYNELALRNHTLPGLYYINGDFANNCKRCILRHKGIYLISTNIGGQVR